MAVSSFLAEGAAIPIPQGSAFTDMTKQTVMPEWYTNYAKDILSGQQAIANRPYATAPMPRVAGFTQAQEKSFGMTDTAAGAYKPMLDAATAATQSAMGRNALQSAQPYFNQATSTSGASAAQPFLGTAGQLTGQSTQPMGQQASQPYFGAAGQLSGVSAAMPSFGQALGTTAQGMQALGMQGAEPYFGAAGQLSGVSAASPSYQQALGTLQQGTSAGGLSAAAPYLGQAGQSSVANIGQYMNPYNDAVTNRIGELGARNLSENILPQIEGRYIQAGQLGYGGRDGMGTPSGMMTDTARALRDVNADVLAQQTAALQSGYTQAAGFAGTDLARQAQLAGTAGQLGSQQQQALLEAAQQQAAVGTQLGQLTGQQQQALTALGTQRGSLGSQQQQALLEAAQQQAAVGTQLGQLTGQQQQALTALGTQAGQLGVSQQQALAQAGQQMGALGQISGSLTQQQQDLLAQIGTSAGNLSGTDITRQLTGAQQLAGLGEDAQRLGLVGAGALGNVGALQQGQGQKNLDVAYADFLRQQGYPQEQVNNMVAALKGVATAVPTATKEYGISPSSVKQEYPASTASNIASGLSGGAALIKELKDAGFFK